MEPIKSNEVMVGNWVMWKGECHRVYAVQNRGVILCAALYRMADESELSGIPLTEEILLKCGFEKSKLAVTGHEGYRVSGDGYYIGLCPHDNAFTFHNPHFNLVVKYLHQLQNLFFCLTQTPLKVEL